MSSELVARQLLNAALIIYMKSQDQHIFIIFFGVAGCKALLGEASAIRERGFGTLCLFVFTNYICLLL